MLEKRLFGFGQEQRHMLPNWLLRQMQFPFSPKLARSQILPLLMIFNPAADCLYAFLQGV
jgi:hypothetical protein